MRSQKLEPIVAASAPALLKQFEKLVVRYFYLSKNTLGSVLILMTSMSDIETVATIGVL